MWDWQTIIALLLVASAAVWVMRRVVRIVSRGLAGDVKQIACGACPKKSGTDRTDPLKTTPLVQLGDKQER